MAILRQFVMSLAALPAVAIPATDVASEIRDAAARIDYGFYTEDLSLILAARDAIPDSRNDAWANYLKAYASYRAALVAQTLGRESSEALNSCFESAEVAADFDASEVEARVLVAACATLAAAEEPVRAVLHQRRYRRALAQVESLDPANPRLALIAFRAEHMSDAAPGAASNAMLAEFRSRSGPFTFPDWGEAEAFAILGALKLESGDRRGARDLIEAALLSAPDYLYALNLAAQIRNLSATN